MPSHVLPFPARFLEKTAHIHAVVNVCNFPVTLALLLSAMLDEDDGHVPSTREGRAVSFGLQWSLLGPI